MSTARPISETKNTLPPLNITQGQGKPSPYSKGRFIFISTILLLIFFAVRLFRIDALPLFIDETLIIQRSQATLAGSPLGFATQGKLLLPWIGSFFNPAVGGWWVMRTVTLLLIMPGIAALIAIGKRFRATSGTVIAVLLIIVSPILHFHDRLALSDTLLTATITLFALSLLIAFDRPQLNWRFASLAGASFVMAMLAKSTVLVLLPLPIIAGILLPKKWTTSERIKGISIIYSAIFLLWMPFQLVLLWRKINFFGRAAQGSTSGALLDFERILWNINFVWEGLSGYWNPLMWVVIAIGLIFAVMRKPRYALFLLALILGFSFALILFGGAPLYLRYWIPVIPMTILLSIVGYAILLDDIPYIATIPLIMSLIFSAPQFIYQSYTNPTELDLPRLDKQQYIQADSAGTALPEIAEFLQESTLPIYGAFAQCPTLELYLEPDITCLNIAGDKGVSIRRINTTLSEIDTPFYLVLESQGYATIDDIEAIQLESLLTIERPGGLLSVIVYEAKSQ